DVRAAEPVTQDRFDARAHLGVVAIPGNVDETGVEALEGVTPQEDAHLIALVQIDHAAHDVHELGDGRLKQLIARIRLEYVQHRLRVMAPRGESETAHDLIDLVAQNGDVARAAVIGGRGPKS